MKRIGIDVGGTFTDVVLIDDETGKVWSTKVPTTPDDRVVGAIDGFQRIIEISGALPEEVTFVGHGTTMATNMVVEGNGAATALITTRGFRDILELRRASRHDRADLYDLSFRNPRPLVDRRWRLEVNERLRFDGSVETPLDVEEVTAVGEKIRDSAIEAVAIVFLHAHANPVHEMAALKLLQEMLPDRVICTSHDVNPEPMEYERSSSTVINAMLAPICGRYIARLEESLRRLGFGGQVMFMQSNGGLATSCVVQNKPVMLLASGPAGGVSAAIRGCERSDVANAILGDMGGTTFDVSLIRDYRPALRGNSIFNSYPVRSPTIDIDSVGAGGGSIAWIDAGGGLRIGPESAGSDPGPACYGRGGDRPTVTDCNLLLGYIDAEAFLGGEFGLDVAAATRAVRREIARPLGIGVVEAARAVREVANALMAQAIRIMTVERGYDPREFSYICYGGAGPVHALDLAEEMGIQRVVIPPLPGMYSAFGMTVADQQYDYQAPIGATVAELAPDQIETGFRNLEKDGLMELERSGIDRTSVASLRRADCRYVGQPDVISIDVPAGSEDLCAVISEAFIGAHRRLWNFTSVDKEVVIANIRVQLVASSGWRGVMQGGSLERGASREATRKRNVWLDGEKSSLPVYMRDHLRTGDCIRGPAVIEEHSTCVVLKSSHAAIIDRNMNLLVELAA